MQWKNYPRNRDQWISYENFEGADVAAIQGWADPHSIPTTAELCRQGPNGMPKNVTLNSRACVVEVVDEMSIPMQMLRRLTHGQPDKFVDLMETQVAGFCKLISETLPRVIQFMTSAQIERAEGALPTNLRKPAKQKGPGRPTKHTPLVEQLSVNEPQPSVGVNQKLHTSKKAPRRKRKAALGRFTEEQLGWLTSDPLVFLYVMQKLHLIANGCNCVRCGKGCTLTQNKVREDGRAAQFTWICSCNKSAQHIARWGCKVGF